MRRIVIFFWATSLLSGMAPRVSSAEEVFGPEHVSKIRTVTAAEISPDGRHTAYLLSVPRRPFKDDDGAAYAELHVVNEKGESRPFITGKVNISQVQWRPDGRAISFIAKRAGDSQRSIYVIPVDGGEARRLIQHETDIGGYSWEKNGERLAFLAQDKEPKEKKETREKGFSQQVYEEDYRLTRVWIAEALDQDEVKTRKIELQGSASEVHWNPARPLLAVVLAPTPLVDDSYMRKTVNIASVEDGSVQAKLEHAAKLGQVQWSPDGSRLFTISGEDLHDPREGRLLLWNVSGAKERDLLPNYEGHVMHAAWREAGKVWFIGAEGLGTLVGEVTIEGERRKVIEAGETVFSEVSVAGDKAVFVGHSARHPSELFALTDGAPERRTQSNPWLDRMRFAEQQGVKHKARDDMDLEGVLIRPLDAEAGKRYPLILAVHGGPEAHVPNGWVTSYSLPGQVAAARGFAVFYPNYRGSTGRGVAFSKLGQADAAGKEFSDLIDAVDHLVKEGLVDPKKAGITGGSYGGYASAWGATYYSDRFAASVMFVGISDNLSKVGTTDIPFEMHSVHHRKWLWEDWDYFLKRSPIYYVQQARTPLLILHGKDDPRVHPSQSLELHRHLKTLGKAPTRLILYPGEGHGNARSASRLDYNLRMLRWFEHFLKDGASEVPSYEISYDAFRDPKKKEEKTDEKEE